MIETQESIQPIEELVSHRVEKMKQLISKGIEPYPTGELWKPTHLSEQILKDYRDLEVGKELKDAVVRVAGRITLRRIMGRASFFDLTDSIGKIQIYIKQDIVGEDNYKTFTDLIDIGDIVGVEGYIFKTKTGELSIFSNRFVLLSKSLRPLPEKWHGLRDPEIRYRQRYLDLISSFEVREVFRKRSQIVDSIRETLKKNNFQEVETPVLQEIPGGALAKPFITYHNALDTELYLRIAPELYLKRLLVGGFDKVYEIGKSFRNEGIDRWHNPEFTMVEIYQAYANYQDMMVLCEDLIKSAARCINPEMVFKFEDKEFSLGKPFARMSFFGTLKEHTGYDFIEVLRDNELFSVSKKLNVEVAKDTPQHKILDAIFNKFVVSKLVEPTFIYDYPAQFSPLSQVKKDAPWIAERFELFIAGEEIANAYSELNNPVLQKEKFLAQQKLKSEGLDSEALLYDESYITALEHGMPPAGGLGIGIDRLTMILTAAPSVREVILFPTLRPEDR